MPTTTALDVDGIVTTDLLGPTQSIRWTPAATYNRFVMVDPERLAAISGILLDERGDK